MTLALLYSDGTMGILSKDTTLDQARSEAKDSDRNETRPEHFTAIVRVKVEILETIETPSLNVERGTCPACGRAQSN